MILHRNVTRTILNTTESTFQTKTPSADVLTFELGITDKFYIGHEQPFASRHFNFSVLNATQRAITVKYWDGTAFTEVEDLVDQTVGFTRNGFISWVNDSKWKTVAQTPITDKKLYWIELTVDGAIDVGTRLQSILNLFTDDNLVRTYYPHLISDTRYLPSGRTDFIEQHQAAKDLVILRLKQDQLIKHEAQIIDPNEVALSAVHAFAYVILDPIAREEGDRDAADKAFKNMNTELNRVKIDVDFDSSGVIESDEEKQGNIFIARG